MCPIVSNGDPWPKMIINPDAVMTCAAGKDHMGGLNYSQGLNVSLFSKLDLKKHINMMRKDIFNICHKIYDEVLDFGLENHEKKLLEVKANEEKLENSEVEFVEKRSLLPDAPINGHQVENNQNQVNSGSSQSRILNFFPKVTPEESYSRFNRVNAKFIRNKESVNVVKSKFVTAKKGFKCQKCQSVFDTADNCRRHIATDHIISNMMTNF